MAIKIVDLPIKKKVDLSIVTLVYQRVMPSEMVLNDRGDENGSRGRERNEAKASIQVPLKNHVNRKCTFW